MGQLGSRSTGPPSRGHDSRRRWRTRAEVRLEVVATTDAVYPVTPLVARRVRSFVLAKSDLDRSTSLAWVVVPLVLAILVEAELLAVAGRPAARTLRVFGWSLVAVFAMLVIVRLRAYAE